MQRLELIEHLLQHELKGLCTKCAFASECLYRKATNKTIIQCELYQLRDDVDVPDEPSTQRSLCTNCSKVDYCQLPGRDMGIWHCEMFE